VITWTDAEQATLAAHRAMAGHVWRVGQVTDCREAGDMVLVARGDEKLWFDPNLAVAMGAAAHRIRERQIADAKHDGAFEWTVGREMWIAAFILALCAVCAAAAMRWL
jgi:hypothetical protein